MVRHFFYTSILWVIASQPMYAQLKPLVKNESDEFFDQGQIPYIKIILDDNAFKQLREKPREYVKCTIIENDKTTYREVGIKLKGAAGSFRDLTDRPALTLNMDRYKKKQKFHDLDKFHLNNSVQDDNWLNEYVCSYLFRSAGIPATRVTHARVWINNRDLGVYVFKEGFGKEFLKRWFPDANGNFYDGGFVRDLDSKLEKDSGDGPDDHKDLDAVVAACREPDPKKRIQRVEELVDLDYFITFMAMERMCCHWDGYVMNMNNYRVYFDPSRKNKMLIFPHGMDQMFQDTNFGLFDQPRTLLSQVVMQNDAWRQKYRERARELYRLFSPTNNLKEQVDQVCKRLQPVLQKMDPNRPKDYENRCRDYKNRLQERTNNLRKLLRSPDPAPVNFGSSKQIELPEWWYGNSESEDTKLEEASKETKISNWTIAVGPSNRCVASFRQGILLRQGTYKLIANLQVQDVVPLDEDKEGGASLRISGAQRQKAISGTKSEKVEYEFVVREDRREVELVIELKAKRGTLKIPMDSIFVQQILGKK